MSVATDDVAPVEHLIARFDLETLDRDLFLGDPGPGDRRLFGGLVAAQSYMAAALTVEEAGERPLHSLHAYFLRPGRYQLPIRFVVDRIRDGRSFTTRRVVAHQGGEAIFNLSASFARIEEGVSHQDARSPGASARGAPHPSQRPVAARSRRPQPHRDAKPGRASQGRRAGAARANRLDEAARTGARRPADPHRAGRVRE